MRRPLITLLLTYSISILGLVLIPGQDAQGNIWHMDFFHAFYFVSYMSTTIGFGEIPYAFNDAQRLWVTISMYASVIAWLYAIGTILTLIQNKNFQHALAKYKLIRQIRKLREPFYLICGYGETGSGLARALTDMGHHVVVVEIDSFRSNMVMLDNLRDDVPALNGDAQKPVHLQDAGLQNPLCQAVVAVTNDNEVNLKIAITSKLLHPDINVICRADSHDIEKNMASFDTNYIVDPFDTFAAYLATSFQAPCLYLLHAWLFSSSDEDNPEDPIYPPIKHHWIVCGFGRFGKAVYKRLKQEGIETIVIEATPDITETPEEGVIKGRGTEADTLIQARIETASGLIAGTNNDANNLSIVVTARQLNPDLFVIVRQNHSDNSSIIKAVNADMVMHPSKIVTDKICALLGTPMLYKFVSLAYYQDNEWACQLTSRIAALDGNQIPQKHEIAINNVQAIAVSQALGRGENVILGDILRDPWGRESELNCIVLLMERNKELILLPSRETEIKPDDRFLFCADRYGFTRLSWNLQHENILNYIQTGHTGIQNRVWQFLKGKGK